MVNWVQVIEGTIFSRSLKSATETLLITDDGSATKVQLEIKRKMRGTAKLGALFVARAQKKELDAALDHLEAALDG